MYQVLRDDEGLQVFHNPLGSFTDQDWICTVFSRDSICWNDYKTPDLEDMKYIVGVVDEFDNWMENAQIVQLD